MKKRLAQIVTSSESFPTRASLFLHKYGEVDVDFHTISSGESVIYSDNFNELNRLNSVAYLDGNDSESTGQGAMFFDNSSVSEDYAQISYNILSENEVGYSFYVRHRGDSAKLDLVVNDIFIQQLSLPSSNTYVWTKFDNKLVFPDNSIHKITLIPSEGNNLFLDKLYFTNEDSSVPSDELEPILYFSTIHVQIYTLDQELLPDSPIPVYDYKTTKTINKSDWYNFDFSAQASFAPNEDFSIVVSSSGGNEHKFCFMANN